MVPVWLLLIFINCALISLLLCWIGKLLFPKFRSGEYKPGPHRSDMPVFPASGREIRTIELPLVGGPALTIAIVITGIGAGFLFNFHADQWRLLLIGLGATVGYMIVGFIDDWHKVHSNEGLSERAKFLGVLFVSMAAAFCYFWLLPKGQEPYSPYKDITGPLFKVLPFTWLIFLMLMTGLIGSVTSLSVDFSDGLDGLAGGLVFSAALAFGIITTGFIDAKHPEGIVLEVLSLLCASAVLGFLPLNWPSSWAARRGSARRMAKIYMGDSGALALGGILAMIAIFSRQEILLLMIGMAFVLEGLSALISARVLTRFFRKQLQLLRHVSNHEFVPHTEFPLPFLATPLHHHFDLLGWDRRRLVYGAWALGAGFSILGVMIVYATETWERYLGRILVLILAWAIWSSGSWSRRYFVGKHPAERTRRRRLALYYGYPYRLMGMRLYHLVEISDANEDVIETPAEELALWQRMSIYDARAMLGLYCYRAGYYPAALAQWTRIPESNRKLRPSIERLLEELDSRLALEQQETQPMRRDQIIRQEPMITGNLPPADLPNPHEPIRSEETQDGRAGGWIDVSQTSFDAFTDGQEDIAPHIQIAFSQAEWKAPQSFLPQEPLLTYTIDSASFPQEHRDENHVAKLVDGANGHIRNAHAETDQLQEATQSAVKQNWLARMFRLSQSRGR
jgi:UDP-N-acetylmuramyl pentapeptide phosphotransferase/UDP-N-acetylglucosamine-1-phosphate transferase